MCDQWGQVDAGKRRLDALIIALRESGTDVDKSLLPDLLARLDPKDRQTSLPSEALVSYVIPIVHLKPSRFLPKNTMHSQPVLLCKRYLQGDQSSAGNMMSYRNAPG